MHQPQAAVGSLRQLVTEADSTGRRYLSVLCSVALAEASVASKPDAHARLELEQLLGRSEKLGVRMEIAKIHYLLGISLRASGDASGAAGQYQQTLSILDEIKKDPGAEHLLERSDLKSIYDDASSGAQQKPS